MAEQTFMTKDQTSFLAALPETTENQIVTGFDSFAPVQFCTPSFLGCKLCIGANVVSGFVTLSVQASTPLGGFTKSFKIVKNINFTWNPIGVFKVEFRITNFRKTSSSFSFNAGIKVCLKVPFIGFKCASFSHTFSIPTLLPQSHSSILNAKPDDEEAVEALVADKDYSTLILMHALLEQKNGCSCESND